MGPGGHGLDLTGVLGDPGSPVHRRDPRAKLLGLLAVVLVAVTCPLAAWPVLAACLLVLAVLAGLARLPARDVWRRARGPLALVLPVALVVPLVRSGGSAWALGPLVVHEAGLGVALLVALKTAVGVGAAVVLTATTPFPEVLRALEALRTPRVVVLVAGLLFRYLHVVTAEAGRMRIALLARGWRPRTVAGAGALGPLTAGLFVRSYERGERVHLAMLARGHDGQLRHATPLASGRADLVFVAVLVIAVVPLRVLGGGA